jgi:hypothetical protein
MSFSRLKSLLTIITSAALTISLSSRAGGDVIASEPVISGQDLRTAKINIAPQNPTANDYVSIKISGKWPNTCIPRNPQVTRPDDKTIRISVSNPSEVCGQALTSWSHTLDIGKLATGAYKVTVNHTSVTGQERLGSKQFNVRP